MASQTDSNGAPFLLNAAAAPTPPAAATADGVTGAIKAGTWGIYLGAVKVLDPDNIIALDYGREFSIADYPLEEGAFRSYNKVARPFDVRLRITKGGNEAARKSFLDTLEKLAAAKKVYSVVTPDRTYSSVNVVRIGYTRSAQDGVSLIAIDIGLREVRITAGAAFANTQDASGQAPVNTGTVQPTATPAPVAASMKTALAKQADLPLLALKGKLQ